MPEPTLTWQDIPGTSLVTPLSCAEYYVISHRKDRYILSYRPPGVHEPVGVGATLAEAKMLAENHNLAIENAKLKK